MSFHVLLNKYDRLDDLDYLHIDSHTADPDDEINSVRPLIYLPLVANAISTRGSLLEVLIVEEPGIRATAHFELDLPASVKDKRSCSNSGSNSHN